MTKTYHFELTERIDRPLTLRVAKAHYTSAEEVHPLVVYFRSKALSNLIKSKHTLRLKNNQHRQQTDVLCTLTETHAIGRYNKEKDDRVFPTEPSKYCRSIDIQFTNNATVLGQSGAASSSTSGSDAELDAMNTAGRLVCWTDFDDSRMFNSLMQESTGVGSEVNFIYDRANAALIWQLAYGVSLVVVNIGDEGAQGVYRNGSWQSVVDTTPLPQNSVLQAEFTFHMVFQQNMINEHSMLAYWSDIKICMWQGSLCYFKLATNHVAHQVSGVSIIPTKPYMLSVQRRDNGSGGHEFHWRVERLETILIMFPIFPFRGTRFAFETPMK